MKKLPENELGVAIGQTKGICYAAHDDVYEGAEDAAEQWGAISMVPGGRKQYSTS